MKILVAIAHYGNKNRAFLNDLLRAYRAMDHDVDIVVLSDRSKSALGPGIEIRVGAPTADPRSLPFAHRKLFADRAGDYDLFIYSEDDTLIEQRHVDAFIEVNSMLPQGQVAGFMRYEIDRRGERSICSVHSHYRWDPESVSVVGDEVFAEFRNQHSACYMLTAAQLEHAIGSGGFLVDAHAGQYDMLVSAATDPYTQCGLTRVLCVSRIEEFLLHHLPNVYLGKLGISESDFMIQIDALMDMAHAGLDRSVLVNPSASLPTSIWNVPCYPSASAELAEMTRHSSGRVLSIGCTSGSLERSLFGPARVILAVPLDNVVSALARSRGIETVSPNLDIALEQLQHEHFDMVFIHELLQHFQDPVAVLTRLANLMTESGRIVVTAPNVSHALMKRRLGRGRHPVPENYVEHGVHWTNGNVLRQWLCEAGFRPVAGLHHASGRYAPLNRLLPGVLGRWFAGTAMVDAVRG